MNKTYYADSGVLVNLHINVPIGNPFNSQWSFRPLVFESINPMPKVSNSLKNKTREYDKSSTLKCLCHARKFDAFSIRLFFDYHRRSKRPTASKCVPFGNKNRESFKKPEDLTL